MTTDTLDKPATTANPPAYYDHPMSAPRLLDLTIDIVPYKKNEYDRGSKKIIVDGLEWGSIDIEFHGCHGPSYHVQDMHGSVYVPRGEGWGRKKGEPMAVSFRAKSAKQFRIANIGKPKDQEIKPLPTSTQLRAHVRELIGHGFLRHPVTRAAELADALARHTELMGKFEREKQDNWDARIAVVMDKGTKDRHALPAPFIAFHPDELKKLISAAMKWAQAQ